MQFPNMNFVEFYSIRLNHLVFHVSPQKLSELMSGYSSRTSSPTEVSRMLVVDAFTDRVVAFLAIG